MTKYILHGGITKGGNPMDDSFFQAITRGRSGKMKILLNYFARQPGEYQKLTALDKVRIHKNTDGADCEFDVAQLDTFREQLTWCDAMYVMGGDTPLLMSLLARVKDLKKLLDGKIYAGTSAAVNALSASYWSNHQERIMEGLGILNIMAKCHFHHEDEEIVKKLLNHDRTLPVLALPEYHWIVMYQ